MSRSANLFRRIFCLALSVVLMMGLAMPGFAASYDVGSAEQLSQSWAEANANKDSSNTFNLTQNIDMIGWGLDAMDNKSYTIQNKGSGDYTLSNVTIFEGQGAVSGKDPQVAIQVDISDNNKKDSDAALYVSGDVSVVVDSDITTKADGGEQSYAMIATNGASVIVLGDVSAKDSGVLAIGESNVTIHGDVEITGNKVDTSFPDYAVAAYENSKLTVNGNVDSTKAGASATDGGGVLIEGNLSADSGDLWLNGGAMLVKGDVDVPGEAIITNWSTLTVKGDLELDGNVSVLNHSKIDVEGSMETTGQVNIYNSSQLLVSNARDMGGLTVNTDPAAPSGIFLDKESWLEVFGETVTDVIYVMNDSDVDIEELKTDYISVGTSGESDDSKIYIKQKISGKNGNTTNVYAAGDSYTQIRSNVRGQVIAVESAWVDIWGNTTNLPQVRDDAIVQINLSSKPDTYYDNEDTYAEDNIVKLCKEYNHKSAMQDHITTLKDIMASASMDLTEKMDLGTAFVISLFQGEDIAMDLIPNFDYDSLLDGGYNKESTENLRNADSVNSYMVQMYKSAIAKSLQAVAETSITETCDENDKKMQKLTSGIFGIMNGLTTGLTTEQNKFLKKAMSNDIFSEAEAREFLIKFGGYEKGEWGIGSATKELLAAYEVSKALKAINTGKKIAITVAEFTDFFSQNYTNQVKVLDNLLENQEMNPEMFVAVVQLRNEYEDDLLGFLGVGIEVTKDLTVDALKDCISGKFPLYNIVDSVMDVAEALGAINKQDAVHKSAPIICYLPSAIEAYEQSIIRIKDGDTSEEAIELVKMNYVFVQESVKALCEYMTVAGDKNQKKEYEQLIKELEKLEIGESLGESEGVLTAENFDEFYENNVDPNMKYNYA